MKEEAEAQEKALDLLEFVGLRRSDAYVTAKNLPYGLQRRLEIAPRPGDRAQAVAAGRADRRHESQRDAST